MPCLKIFTNLARSSIPKNFAVKIAPVLAATVKKSEERFMVTVCTDVIQSMYLDDVTPSIFASLESIGHLGPEENKIISRALTDFLEKELGVQPDRIWLIFTDIKASDLAIAGNTRG